MKASYISHVLLLELKFVSRDRSMSGNLLKVTPTSFWLKHINSRKCIKFCSTHKLKVADKYFGLLRMSATAALLRYVKFNLAPKSCLRTVLLT